MDAYEFSFVAVPAQRSAGVIKGMGGKQMCLKDLSEQFGAQAEYRTLYKQAQLGVAYEKQIRSDVVRLCLSLELGIEEPVLHSIMEKAGAEELLKVKSALEERLREYMPVVMQLCPGKEHRETVESGFLI